MTTTSVMKITTLDARHAPHRAPPMHQPVDQPLIEPPSAHLLDHGREPGEECRRVGIIESRTTDDREQAHLDHAPAARRATPHRPLVAEPGYKDGTAARNPGASQCATRAPS
jgi:hypothetical protein